MKVVKSLLGNVRNREENFKATLMNVDKSTSKLWFIVN